MRKSLFLGFLCGALLLIACGPSSSNSPLKASAISNVVKSWVEDNDLWMEDNIDFVDNGMTEELFNKIIDGVEKVYAPIVKELGGNLVLHKDWASTEVNAYADREDGNFNVTLLGGLARRSEITEDGFAMVVGHEIAHHIGGFPLYNQGDWASNEGNSDTISFLAVAKNLWGYSVYNENITDIDPEAKRLCDKYYTSEKDMNLCYRKMNAGYSLANLLGTLGGTNVNFKTPDKKIVKKTSNSHPKAQCRLDTMVASTLCDIAWEDKVIPQTEQEMAKQSCINHSKTEYDIQARPRCWFKQTI
jgi:hypothetical protein